jgi:hypothetical protein
LLDEIVFVKLIALGNDIVLKGKTMLVHVAKMSYNFIGKYFSTRAGYNRKVCRFGIWHINLCLSAKPCSWHLVIAANSVGIDTSAKSLFGQSPSETQAERLSKTARLRSKRPEQRAKAMP